MPHPVDFFERIFREVESVGLAWTNYVGYSYRGSCSCLQNHTQTNKKRHKYNHLLKKSRQENERFIIVKQIFKMQPLSNIFLCIIGHVCVFIIKKNIYNRTHGGLNITKTGFHGIQKTRRSK